MKVDLRLPVFSHEQLYVALSRFTNVHNIAELLPQGILGERVANIVYPEVLLESN